MAKQKHKDQWVQYLNRTNRKNLFSPLSGDPEHGKKKPPEASFEKYLEMLQAFPETDRIRQESLTPLEATKEIRTESDQVIRANHKPAYKHKGLRRRT